jgi:hypothetical protein
LFGDPCGSAVNVIFMVRGAPPLMTTRWVTLILTLLIAVPALVGADTIERRPSASACATAYVDVLLERADIRDLVLSALRPRRALGESAGWEALAGC